MKHVKFVEVSTLVSCGISVLLTGERGSGKTTLAKHVTEELNLKFHTVSMTRQTTLSHLLGFMNVNGTYIPSHIRRAAEEGGVVLLDEIDAADPNVMLCLNTIENGYLSFPDKIIELHEDFRLMATSNPQDNHRDYNGRSKLDASTLDRFDIVDVERDSKLELSLVDKNTYAQISLVRNCLEQANSSTYISMRDTIRYQKRKDLDLLDGFVEKLMSKDLVAFESYKSKYQKIPKVYNISECEKLSDVWDFVTSDSDQGDAPWES